MTVGFELKNANSKTVLHSDHPVLGVHSWETISHRGAYNAASYVGTYPFPTGITSGYESLPSTFYWIDVPTVKDGKGVLPFIRLDVGDWLFPVSRTATNGPLSHLSNRTSIDVAYAQSMSEFPAPTENYGFETFDASGRRTFNGERTPVFVTGSLLATSGIVGDWFNLMSYRQPALYPSGLYKTHVVGLHRNSVTGIRKRYFYGGASSFQAPAAAILPNIGMHAQIDTSQI